MPATATRPFGTLLDLLAGLPENGERPAVIAFEDTGARTQSYGELDDQARRFAGGLRQRGLKTGERVAIYAPNGPEWIVARVGLLMAGGVAVSLDTDLTREQLRDQLADSGAGRIFTSMANLAAVKGAIDEGCDIWLLDAAAEDSRALHHLLDAEPLRELPEVSEDDIASLFYTSGTTGRPKGVPLTHRNIVGNIEAILAQDLVGKDDRVLLPLPLHHSYPFIVGMLIPLMVGATIVLPRDVSGPEIRRALSKGEATVVVGVPRLYEALACGLTERLKGGGAAERVMYRLLRLSGWLRRRFGRLWGRILLRPLHRRLAPRLRLLASGGAKLDAEVAERLEAFGWMVLSGYGLVETASISTFNPPGRARQATAGLPAPGVEIRIVEPDAQGRGEVQIRGPSVFSGYLANPEANAAAFTEDGWFRTADLGTLDDDGYLTIAGRIKEMIVLPDGKNIAPEEVEAVYAESPYIREIAVLEWHGRLVGLVVPEMEAIKQAGTRIEDIIRVALAELSPRLPGYKRLGDWAITREPLPRTRLGKYQRHELPPIYDRVRRGERGAASGELSPADAELLQRPRARQVFDWLQAKFPEHALSPDTSPQLDLGIDSLAWVQLGMEIEARFEIALTEEAVARAMTLRELLEEVEAAAPAGPAQGEAQRRALEEARRCLRPQGRITRVAARILHMDIQIISRIVYRLDVEGADKLPARGPFVVTPNHASDLDAFMLIAALPGRYREQLTWGADRERVFGNRLGRLAARLANLFPVDDRTPGASLAVAVEALRQGRVLVWFPEEWRSPDGRLQAFLPGIGRILKETRALAVPCHIAGTFEAMPRGQRWPDPEKISVTFGEPVSYEALEAAAGGDDESALADALRARVAALVARAGKSGDR